MHGTLSNNYMVTRGPHGECHDILAFTRTLHKFLFYSLHYARKSLDVAKMGFENQITKEAIKDVEDTLQIMKDGAEDAGV